MPPGISLMGSSKRGDFLLTAPCVRGLPRALMPRHQLVVDMNDGLLQPAGSMPAPTWKSITPRSAPIRWSLALFLGTLVGPLLVVESVRGLIHRGEGMTAGLLLALGVVLVVSCAALLCKAAENEERALSNRTDEGPCRR